MKIALLSDIHANDIALAAVLAAARADGVEQLICCGDFVGYYYEPGQVLSLLDAWPWIGIRGNHEDMLSKWLDGVGHAEIHDRYGSGIAVAAELPRATLDRLLELPERKELDIDGHRVLLCHGSSWDQNRYVYPNAADHDRCRMAANGEDLVVFGHTHYPVVWQVNHTTVVNPGSVGQPRDRKPGASWALWDTITMTVRLRRTEFDFEAVAGRAAQLDPQLPYLSDVLRRR
jgi:putative phosphoesterase